MTSLQGFDAEIERVDDLPVIFGLLQEMGIQGILDSIIVRHGNWQGLSPGWVITVWLMHILSEHHHLMEPVQAWVEHRLHILQHLTGQEVRGLDFSDDRLALCLFYLQKRDTWTEVEGRLGQTLLRVYKLTGRPVVRVDATTGTVNHNPEQHTLFQVGKAKNGLYEKQFKMMLASLDPLGLPLVVDVVPGNQADDPLYVPSYRRVKGVVNQSGLLVVGDSKMSALATRATVVAGEDYYLTPLAHQKDEPTLMDDLLRTWQEREQEASRIFLPEDIPTGGSEPDLQRAIARGFEVNRERRAAVAGQTFIWQERLLVIRSFSYVKTMQQGLHRRLTKAETAFAKLTPPPQRGKRQIKDEASLLSSIEAIEKRYRVQGLFHFSYQQEVEERTIRGYRGKPDRVERKVRYQLTVSRNHDAIAAAEFRAGWRIYATNAPAGELSLCQAVLAYRDQYIAENVFRRLQGKFLSITPVYVQRDDHARGLFHLLTLGARVLALGDYLAKQALAQKQSQLTGIYSGNPKRGTARPTTERMLNAFDNINLLIIPSEIQVHCFLTPLSPVQERILTLLGLSLSLYTDLQSA